MLHDVGGVKNFNVVQFYIRIGFVKPQAVGKRNKGFAVLASGGLDVFSAEGVGMVLDTVTCTSSPCGTTCSPVSSQTV